MTARTLVALCVILAGCTAGPPPAATPSGTLAGSPATSEPDPVETTSAEPSSSAGGDADQCTGLESAGIGLPPTARQYLAAWNERDAEARRGIMDTIWAEGAHYVDAQSLADSPAVGRAAMSDLIARNQGEAGSWFEPRAWSEGYAHHDLLVMPWRHCTADGPTGMIGTDYAELDATGRIVLAVGFSPLTPDGSGVGDQAGTACAEPGSWDWSEVPPIVVSWDAAWNATATAEREAILAPITNDETLLAASWDPSRAVGPAQITAFIDQWKVPGNYIEFSAWGDAEAHDGWFHARWRDCSSPEDFVEGIEVLHVGSDGKLDRVASFASW